MGNGPEREPGGLGKDSTPGDLEGAGADTAPDTTSGAPAPRDAGLTALPGLAGDEEALRRMLQGVVEDLTPSEGALDHLRRAVPARRARKRQALVGAAAAVLLVGTAVPAFVHVASSGSGDSANPVNAGHGQQAQGGAGNEPGATGGDRDPLNPPAGGGPGSTGEDAASVSPGDGSAEGAADGTSGEPETPGAAGAQPPACTPSQLGVASAGTNVPDAEGKVYGTFRIANVSSSDCLVTGAGSVGVTALGAADAARISVVGHTAGDPAGGLPDPSAAVASLVLTPSSAYEVKFAWIPSDTCPTTGASPDPTPTDGGTGSGGGSGGGTAGTGTSGGTDTGTGTTDGVQTQMLTEGGVKDGSVAVSHTAEAGAPSAQTTIGNACSGTVYRTGILPGA
ncbi:hypothetical protein AB0957_03590 [Streptomyces zhihengii]|uniref:hypothetical protein n=1 Tax=Streptomyces zhihengii TaxID=1818004 RepID=UPI00345525E5